MFGRIRRLASTSSLAAVIFLGSLPLLAQEPAASKPVEKPEAPVTKRDNSRRVPRYFGQVGLTPEQRESIYAIQAKHQAKIDSLEKQVLELQAQVKAECEAVLTPTQKQLLEQRRKAAATSKKSTTVAAGLTKPGGAGK